MGGTLKRKADEYVRHGGDIPNAQTLFNQLKKFGTSVELFFFGRGRWEKKVQEMMDASQLVPVKGQMKMHQVPSLSLEVIKY